MAVSAGSPENESGGGHLWRNVAIGLGVLCALLLFVVIFDSDDSEQVSDVQTTTEQADPAATERQAAEDRADDAAAARRERERVDRAKAKRARAARRQKRREFRIAVAPELEDYAGAAFTARVPTDWTLERGDEDQGGFLRSQWRDPVNPESSVLVDAVAGETISAAEKAAEVRAVTSSSPGYDEISFGPTLLDGREAHRWEFGVQGDRPRMSRSPWNFG